MGDTRFTLDDFEPAYLALHSSGELLRRTEAALEELKDCAACPRDCHVNRLESVPAICGTGRHAVVSSAMPHHGEEDCLKGVNGSGTIFFSHCNLRCVFCQNWEISQRARGRECRGEEIAELMMALQREGCHNINLVTPEHVVPQVIEAISLAADSGLHIPIVYNTSAYDCLSSLRLLDGIVDIYMPDFKFWRRDSSKHLVKAKDYPERARTAIAEMHRQVGPLKLGRDGIARRGVLVRHLVMPGMLDESAEIFAWLANDLSPHTYVNVMGQYRPLYEVTTKERYAEIRRMPAMRELVEARVRAQDAGLYRFA